MTDELFNELRYVDVKIKQNFSPTPGGSQVTTEIKIPCFSIQQALAQLEIVFQAKVDNVVSMTVFRVGKIYGKMRYDYRVVREYSEQETCKIVSYYIKYNRKKYIR